MLKRIILLISIIITVKALEDRAFFAINDRVYFLSEVNRYIDFSNNRKCLKKHFPLTSHVFAKKISKVSMKKTSFEPEEIADVMKLSFFFKIDAVSDNKISVITKNQYKGCKSTKKILESFLRVEQYLKQRVLTTNQSKVEIANTLSLLEKSLSQKVEYRAYY